jgi:hypothetical protein
MTIADSYAIQREWVRLQRDAGRRVIGHKIGLTSRAMQIASQITEPDYGTLLDSMLLRDGSEVEAARFIVPRFEVEFAFVLARPLEGPHVTVFDVLNATDHVVPALELIDARIEQFDRHTKAPRKVLDTIADNAANAGIVLGGRPMRPDAVDWRWAGQRRGLAGQQAGAARRTSGGRRDRARRQLHAAGGLRGRRHLPCRLRPAGVDFREVRLMRTPQCVQAFAGRTDPAHRAVDVTLAPARHRPGPRAPRRAARLWAGVGVPACA